MMQPGLVQPGMSLMSLPPQPSLAPQPVLNPENFADVLAGKDSITAVNQFCQRFSGQIMNGESIVYTVVKLPDGHQCTLKLECLDGVEFAGEVCSNAKEARLSAAQQVLEMYAAEIASMPATTTKSKKKRPASGLGGGPDPKMARLAGGPDAAGIPAPPNQSNKGDLNTTYSKIIRRPTNKGEVLFSTNQVVGGFQSQVQLPGLPPPWNNEIWAGEVHPKKADAEQSVAGVALATIQSDPSLMAAFNKPPKPNQWLLNGGMDRKGGKGKGKGKDDKGGGFRGHPSIGGSGGWDAAPQMAHGAVAATGGADAAIWQAMLANQYNAINAMGGGLLH